MPAELQSLAPAEVAALRLPPVPWRDPHSVSPARLREYIATLEALCEQNPRSADLRTCLGMAYAMNFQPYQSMDSLEAARDIEPENFFAQLKYAELLYRLRALPRAERETLQALEVARTHWEVSIARRQLLDIRKLIREGTQKPAWTKPLAAPAAALALMLVLLLLVNLWR
ncbi:MAG: hypothetical protein ABSH05_12115 [Bryobacteraceae bacterium]|jgi:hypothetical protein